MCTNCLIQGLGEGEREAQTVWLSILDIDTATMVWMG